MADQHTWDPWEDTVGKGTVALVESVQLSIYLAGCYCTTEPLAVGGLEREEFTLVGFTEYVGQQDQVVILSVLLLNINTQKICFIIPGVAAHILIKSC